MSSSLSLLNQLSTNDLAKHMAALIRDSRGRPGTNQREGQLLMNALQILDPELGLIVVQEYPQADCFYDDSKIPAFFELLFSPRMTK